MIHLDVTSACRSALNTGVKRIQRGMHASLSGRADYYPVCWQAAHGAYRGLDADDYAMLEQKREPRGWALFDSFAPGLVADRMHYFRHRGALVDWPRRLEKGDVLLVPDLIWDRRGIFLASLRDTPARRIGVFHDAIALRHPHQSRIDRFHAWRGIRALAALDGVLCISQEAESDLKNFWREGGLAAAPTQVTPWPVPFAGARPLRAPNFPARRLLYVARLEPHKNHLRLLEACEWLWCDGVPFELELIGCLAYPDAAWKILRRVRALRRAGRRIRWRAHVDEAELHAAYARCSATVFPSLLEGFGLPVLESLWHGRPVVCGANGALGEVSRDGGCEAVDTSGVESMAAGMRRMLTDETRYEMLAAQAAARRFRTWADYWTEVDGFCRGA